MESHFNSCCEKRDTLLTQVARHVPPPATLGTGVAWLCLHCRGLVALAYVKGENTSSRLPESRVNYRSAGCVLSSVTLAETQGRQQDCYVQSKQPRYSPPPRRSMLTSGRDCRRIAILGIQSPVEFETREQNIREQVWRSQVISFFLMCHYALEFLTRIQLTCMLILYCRQ